MSFRPKAKDDARGKPDAVLPGGAETGHKVIRLDQAQRHAPRDLQIRTATHDQANPEFRLRDIQEFGPASHCSDHAMDEGDKSRMLAIGEHRAVHQSLRIGLEPGLGAVVAAEIQNAAEPRVEVLRHRNVKAVEIEVATDVAEVHIWGQIRVTAKHFHFGCLLRQGRHRRNQQRQEDQSLSHEVSPSLA